MKYTRPGLTLIEVLLAVLILGIVSTSLLSLQGRLMRGVYSGHLFLERLGFIRSFFVTGEKDRLFTVGSEQKKEIEDPDMTLTYTQLRPVSTKFSDHKHLVVDQVEASWPQLFGRHRALFGRYRFLPQKEKHS